MRGKKERERERDRERETEREREKVRCLGHSYLLPRKKKDKKYFSPVSK